MAIPYSPSLPPHSKSLHVPLLYLVPPCPPTGQTHMPLQLLHLCGFRETQARLFLKNSQLCGESGNLKQAACYSNQTRLCATLALVRSILKAGPFPAAHMAVQEDGVWGPPEEEDGWDYKLSLCPPPPGGNFRGSCDGHPCPPLLRIFCQF